MASTRTDFRTYRKLLPPEAFALSTGPDSPPSDLIEEEIWHSIISLPDDVSLRTSDHYGSCLGHGWELWGRWISVLETLARPSGVGKESPIAVAASDVLDLLQASLFNSLTGYYRAAFSCLRTIWEEMTIGLELQLSGDAKAFAEWCNGDREFRFGSAADRLQGNPRVAKVERETQGLVEDNFFRQSRPPSGTGGFARRSFRTLSGFAHSRPGSSDAILWGGSNGPIFVEEAFEQWYRIFLEAYAFSLVAAKLSEPEVWRTTLDSGPTVSELFRTVVALLPADTDAAKLFAAVPDDL